MKHKDCFVNGHCAYDCPNFQVDYFEEKYDLPASEVGFERIKCKECYLNSFECSDCYLENTDECPEKKSDSEKLITII